MPDYFSVCDSMADLVERYDGFILDLWGVIHDGQQLYAGAHDCLLALKAANKRVVLLSNAPRRAALAELNLQRMGIFPDCYDMLITSGEIVFRKLAATEKFEKKYLIVGPERDSALLDGLSKYQRVLSVAEAEFLLVTGFDDDASEIDEKMEIITAARARNLPLICANPDLEIVRQTGVRAWCAGVIAEQYRKLGGEVIEIGKPYEEVYAECFSVLANIEKAKILAVGDNLLTDIRGANAQKIDSCLIAGGVLSYEISGAIESEDFQKKLKDKCNETKAFPEFIAQRFVF
jgi:HAD superfamily hydrolase (TIGR01459 family)